MLILFILGPNPRWIAGHSEINPETRSPETGLWERRDDVLAISSQTRGLPTSLSMPKTPFPEGVKTLRNRLAQECYWFASKRTVLEQVYLMWVAPRGSKARFRSTNKIGTKSVQNLQQTKCGFGFRNKVNCSLDISRGVPWTGRIPTKLGH
jgi:hypothetical protein